MNTTTRPQPDPRDRISLAYDSTLAATTRFGSVLTALGILSFLLWYWLAGYPRPVLWAGLAALLVVLPGCALAYYRERYRLAAHLTIRPNSLLVFDIDHFKEINDTYGHAVGDQVLRWFSMICRCNLRQGDILARIGGDEFVIFLPATDSAAALGIAERLCEELSSTVAQTLPADIRITSSIGLASHSRQADIELETLLKAADHALYQAKRDGRNRVCVAATV
ncbi:GGDEF domain-containing protein [uncultured Thiodictyon sp.]|uniref:GGDEF domain-containing protein n=1 Tax=uncultured Thiodictyon sp. TaxID=1846217 RepID=UPI0025F1BFF9|nr:GGDEF domain-containing protein [uncultured Thiodictyon sp.]